MCGDDEVCPEVFAALPVNQDAANVQGRCCPIEEIPQTTYERQKSCVAVRKAKMPFLDLQRFFFALLYSVC